MDESKSDWVIHLFNQQVAYQKILTLAYVDKLIDDIHREFRDKYKDVLKSGQLMNGTFDFSEEFHSMLKSAEEDNRKAGSKVKKVSLD